MKREEGQIDGREGEKEKGGEERAKKGIVEREEGRKGEKEI